MTIASSGRVFRLGVVLLVASLPAVFAAGTISRASGLWLLAEGARPYWPATDGVLLHLLVPGVILSAIALMLAPGLLLAIAMGRGTSVPVWFVSAVPGSILSTILVVEGARRLLPATSYGLHPGLLMLASVGLCTAVASVVASRRDLPWPMVARNDRLSVAAAAIGVVVLYLVLAPKFLWESFNGDGAHAFEVSRLLLRKAWPFFPASAGVIESFPGTTSMLFTFPNAWFIRLFGPTESAVRLPWLLYLPLMVFGLQAIAEEGGRRLEGRTQLALWAGVLPFVFAMAFSASYSPYHADVALPAVQDTLLVVTILGFIHAMVRRAWGWVAAFGLLAYVGLPNGFLLMGFWLLAELAVVRPRPWRVAAQSLLLLVACIAVAATFAAVLAWTGQTPPGGEYGLSRTIADVLRIDLSQWRRLLYLLVGGAGLPVVALLWWPRQDQVARRVTLVVVGYFLFFAVQARFSLHHLVPAMILPLAVAARLRPEGDRQSLGFHGAWYLSALGALVLSLPASFAVSTTERRLGMTITQQIGSYGASDPAVFDAATLLSEAFPSDWDPAVPTSSYGGSPLSWLPYAREGAPRAETVHLLAPRGAADSVRGAAFATTATVRLDVLDLPGYAAQRALRPPTNTHAAIYAVPRATLFGGRGPHTINVANLLRHALHRLGLRTGSGEAP